MLEKGKKSQMTPRKAIRQICIKCVDGFRDVQDCGGDKCLGGQGDGNGVCYFWPYRMGRGRPSVKLIRKFCLECMDRGYQLVEGCQNQLCPLHQYRLGKHPKRAGQVNKGSFKPSVSRA
jgi:hypothetical protein